MIQAPRKASQRERAQLTTHVRLIQKDKWAIGVVY